MDEEPGPSNAKQMRVYGTEDTENTSEDNMEFEESSSEESSDESEEIEFQLLDFTDSDAAWTDVGPVKSISFTGNPGLSHNPDGNCPIDYFNLLFEESFFDEIVERTNAHATHLFLSGTREKSRLTEWKNLTVQELRKFIGLLLHMGTIQIHRIQDYWKKHRLFDFTCFSRHMGRNRFFLILRCLHFCEFLDEKKVEDSPDLRLVKFVVDYFNQKMNETYYPTRELLVDEIVIPWREKRRRNYREKRHKHDVKLCALTEPTGPTVRVEIFTEDDEQKEPARYTQNFVLNLLQGKVCRGHSLYVNHNYNSVTLTETLLSYDTYATGLLKGFRDICCKEVVEAKLKKDELIARYRNGIVMGKWQGNREILFVSSEHTGELSETKNKSGNSRKKPNAIIQYNKFTRGIDKKMQMLSYYAYDRKIVRWYIKVFMYITETLILNSYYLYNRYSGKPNVNFYDYRLDIIDNLLFGNEMVQVFVPKIPAHFPQKLNRAMSHARRKRCRVCYKNGIRRDSPFFCPKCTDQPGLCLDPCFRIYHTR